MITWNDIEQWYRDMGVDTDSEFIRDQISARLRFSKHLTEEYGEKKARELLALPPKED
jgi:hypothetical protein